MGGVTFLVLAVLVNLTFARLHHDTLPEALSESNLRALTHNVYIMYSAARVHVFASH